MGNVLIWIKNLVNWIGGLFASVLKWFKGEIREEVQQKTEDFLIEKEPKISKCDNPKLVAKVAGQKKALKELEKKAEEEEKKLTENDAEAIKELFKEDIDF